jgi:succinoglycan biosynthesis transport protein ExoP
MHHLLGQITADADLCIIDSPPVLAVTDAAILSTMADGVVIVVDLTQTKRRDLKRARESIEAVGGRILGVVINRLKPSGAGYYYYQYGYQYTYGPDGRKRADSEDKNSKRPGSRDRHQEVLSKK